MPCTGKLWFFLRSHPEGNKPPIFGNNTGLKSGGPAFPRGKGLPALERRAVAEDAATEGWVIPPPDLPVSTSHITTLDVAFPGG